MRLVLVLLFLGAMSTPTLIGQTPSSPNAPVKSALQTCTLQVTGMTCAGCEAAVRIAATKVTGVTEVKVSYEKRSAVVTFDPTKTTPAAIAKVIADKTGYKTVPQAGK